MTKPELDELLDIIDSAVWNMCNEISCSDCHYFDHFKSLTECPINKLCNFAEKMRGPDNKSILSAICDACSMESYKHCGQCKIHRERAKLKGEAQDGQT